MYQVTVQYADQYEGESVPVMIEPIRTDMCCILPTVEQAQNYLLTAALYDPGNRRRCDLPEPEILGGTSPESAAIVVYWGGFPSSRYEGYSRVYRTATFEYLPI